MLICRMMPPLAERMRPRTLEECVGQEHLIGPDGPLRLARDTGVIPSCILWGPPGSGKTSLARVLARHFPGRTMHLSAVMAGVKEIREVAAIARAEPVLLFIDEIHRFNKSQQDALLPHIESGHVTLIGATTENPSFEVIGPLLSRARVFVVHPLTAEHLTALCERALADPDRGLGERKIRATPDAVAAIATLADGDARRAFGALELSAALARAQAHQEITAALVAKAWQQSLPQYDKAGEEHYNVISAFIKSLRGSDPDAAVYWLARMLEAGEEPLFICRRMVIFASEDVGNADPHALPLAVATMQAFDFVGMPEGWIPLAQCATYLASVPKSNASYLAYLDAKADMAKQGSLPVPLHLRNAPTKLMRDLSYGAAYRSPHDFPDHHTRQQYLPDALRSRRYYQPSEQGFEAKIAERLRRLRKD